MSDRPSLGEAFRVLAEGTCVVCSAQVEGRIAFNRESRVVDSEGFLVSPKGLTCDACLAEQGAATSVTARV